jgi:hypothetical protein
MMPPIALKSIRLRTPQGVYSGIAAEREYLRRLDEVCPHWSAQGGCQYRGCGPDDKYSEICPYIDKSHWKCPILRLLCGGAE